MSAKDGSSGRWRVSSPTTIFDSKLVTLDDAPLGGIEIVAWGQPQGTTDVSGNGMWTYTESDQLTGEYVLNVSPLVNSEGYFLWPWNWPDGTYMNNSLDNIPAGASMVNINFIPATGGLYGVVTVLGSSPVDTLLDVGIFIYDATTGFETWTNPDWETGEYRVHLPTGNYYVDVYTREFKPYMAGPFAVASTFIQHNNALDEILFDSAIYGQVTDAEGLFGLGGADVWIWSETLEYNDHMLTDSVGNFYFEVPASNYEVGTQAEGYFGAHLTVTAPVAGSVEASFALEKFNFRPPVIISIVDKPADQGGWALINFAGGSSDSGPFFGWSIWSVPGEDYFPEQMINVGFFLGDGRQNYTVLVPTFVDSNSTNGGTPDLYQSWYVITGFGDSNDEGGMFIANSQPAAGWSVDNLAPGVPAGLSLSTSTVAGEFSLAWDSSEDTDYQYNVVRVAYTSGGEVLLNVSGTSIALTGANITVGSEFEVSVAAVDYNGNYSSFSIALNSVTLDLEDGMSLPGNYALLANYPNPFNPSTVLQFELPRSDKVSLIVYDLTGREIRSLISSDLPAGHHRVVWDGRDGRGYGIATGVYFYRIVTGSGFTATRKMVFMK
ncbi:MAG: T9SS type A sorting domain-containing protein [Candidatus Marinimicrobia bacterium]|nr:T9SS type A sorting domain-containing protein [Candidatus Neomarinimicrobiota bacterium]